MKPHVMIRGRWGGGAVLTRSLIDKQDIIPSSSKVGLGAVGACPEWGNWELLLCRDLGGMYRNWGAGERGEGRNVLRAAPSAL